MSRASTAVLAAACLLFALPAMAQLNPLPGMTDSPSTGRSTTVKSSKSNSIDRTTTVKSSKSNTSDRMGGGGGGKGATGRTTTVKSSKSNTSD
jgi:hypothetical protein